MPVQAAHESHGPLCMSLLLCNSKPPSEHLGLQLTRAIQLVCPSLRIQDGAKTQSRVSWAQSFDCR